MEAILLLTELLSTVRSSLRERERLRYLEQLMVRNWVPALKPMLPT